MVVVKAEIPMHGGGGEGERERDATAKDCTCMQCPPSLYLYPQYTAVVVVVVGAGWGCWGMVGSRRRGRDDETYVPDPRPLLPQGDSPRRGAVPSLLVGDFHSVPLVIIRLKEKKKLGSGAVCSLVALVTARRRWCWGLVVVETALKTQAAAAQEA